MSLPFIQIWLSIIQLKKYVFAVRDRDTVKHYLITPLPEGGYCVPLSKIIFHTLYELVEHYSRDADGMCVNLRKPCSQVCGLECNMHPGFKTLTLVWAKLKTRY